jgi:hypothetical protein
MENGTWKMGTYFSTGTSEEEELRSQHVYLLATGHRKTNRTHAPSASIMQDNKLLHTLHPPA